MSKQPDLLPETQLELLAAAAFAQGRVARRALGEDGLPPLDKRDNELVEMLIQAIDRRMIIQDSIAWDIEMLLETLEARVESGTTRATVWPDECDMSHSSYVETRRTPEAQLLAAACRELRKLQDAIAAVLDRVHARHVVDDANRVVSAAASSTGSESASGRESDTGWSSVRGPAQQERGRINRPISPPQDRSGARTRRRTFLLLPCRRVRSIVVSAIVRFR